MTHGVLVQNKIVAKDIDSLNRTAVGSDDIDNGFVFQLLTEDTASTYGQLETWDASKPTSANSGLTQLWMAYEPEVVITTDGNHSYKGLNSDPRNFYNIAGSFFSVYKPQIGDIILMTGDCLAGSKASNGFVVATDSDYHLNWAASAISGLSYALIGTSYISLGDGSIGTQRVTAYSFRCVAIA